MNKPPRYKVGDRVWVKEPPNGLNWRGQPIPNSNELTSIGSTGPFLGTVRGIGPNSYLIDIEGKDSLWYWFGSVGDPFLEAIREAREDTKCNGRRILRIFL